MTNITVLGGSGFVGKSLLQKLESKKFKVKVMVNSSKIKNKFKKFHGDILDKKTFENQIKNGDIIVFVYTPSQECYIYESFPFFLCGFTS